MNDFKRVMREARRNARRARRETRLQRFRENALPTIHKVADVVIAVFSLIRINVKR